jgi:uncharacterized protein YecE (DUF72 family)
MGKIWIGTSGFNYKDWRGDFYPESLPQKIWLEYYSTKFKTVEINATFYGSFRKQAFRNWADTVPDDFIFAVKGSRFITHVKHLKNPEDSIKRFFGQIINLKQKLGVVLWQFPPNFKNNIENKVRLEQFLKSLPKKVPQVFEFRDNSWFENEVYKLLDHTRAGIVISESSVFPFKEVVVGGICYIRFHGPTRLYSSPYSTEQLKAWAEKIRKWSGSSDVFCYFNNDSGGHAFRNAAELGKIVGLE